MLKYDVVIVGAGAAGLTAAYEITRSNNRIKVLVIEKNATVGKKLSATGNGKCNLTNARFDGERYFSSNRAFIDEWSGLHTYSEIVSFFEEMGVLLYEKDGYYYPLSNQAKQITEAYYENATGQGVTFWLNTKVSDFSVKNEKYQIQTSGEHETTLLCENVILALGGSAASKLGGTKEGYSIAKKLSLGINKVYPALTPAYVEDRNLKFAKGVRHDVLIHLKDPDGGIRKERGQLQINEDSLSGIAMMNLSCRFNTYNSEMRKECLFLDLVPDYSWNEMKEFFEKQRSARAMTIEQFLNGILPAKLGIYICKRLNIDSKLSLMDATEKQINRLVSLMKKMTFTPIDVADYEKAQVSAGGVSVDEIEWSTFEVKRYKGLYIVGELLDVTGECGGYNLTFAILSALQASKHIVNCFFGKEKR